MAALLAGQATDKIARDFNMPEGTVKAWKSKHEHATEDLVSVPDAHKGEVGALLVDYLRETLETLTFQQRTVFRDEAWLKRQDASELAVLHGVSADKATRLTEALERATPKPESDAGAEQ